MTNDQRHRRMEAARVRAELSVHDLWLRYLALGGTEDAFDLDGYLQGLVPMETFQQDVLAQALNEALEDGYRSYRISMSTPSPADPADDRLARLVAELLDNHRPASGDGPESPDDGPV